MSLVALVAAGLVTPAPRAEPSGPPVDVIVRGRTSDEARRAVVAAGGTITTDLPIVDGVAARVPASGLAGLVSYDGVVAVTPNSQVTFQGAAEEAKKCSEYKRKKRRQRCRARLRRERLRTQNLVRASKLWEEGITGATSTIAILDTGIYADHADLGDRVLHCEDFSSEFADSVPLPEPTAVPTDLPTPLPTDILPTPLPTDLPDLPSPAQEGDEPPVSEEGCTDTFGHGTFMAGLVAGDGTSSAFKRMGTAPGAKLVGIKAAGFDGSTDISKILAGIQWAVSFKDAFNPPIRVLNLSLGTDAAQTYRSSPLNFAVERAWKSGIVVVVSAGNSGSDPQTVMKPGDDPYVVTVGASDHRGTPAVGDDQVPVFSSRGATRADQLSKPDLVAPGVHTVSLRSPGSAIDQHFPDARVGDNYFRGTGTSMSTATVSGIVALMLEAHDLTDESLTPDEVKHRLLETARTISNNDPLHAGQGLVDAYRAARADVLPGAPQNFEESDGLGFLDLDRGSVSVDVIVPPDNSIALDGELVSLYSLDPLDPGSLLPWLSLTYTADPWTPDSWNASTWKTDEWAATTWTADPNASTWKATTWEASTWKGTEWENPEEWNASTWKNGEWDASTWKSRWYAAGWE